MSVAPTELETQLNDFDPQVRSSALRTLLQRQPTAPVVPTEVANLHCHTFFSFNAYGYSPTGLAWLARQNGYGLMGIVDFDVLDGVDEFLDACFRARVRGSAGIETRTYLPEFADYEMNSPGEPGVLYHMGVGFTSGEVSPRASAILTELRDQSTARNIDLISRVNAYLDPVQVDYADDVLPLTPKGNATERHIVVAYIAVAEREYPDPVQRVAFWADRLDLPAVKVEQLMQDVPAFQGTVRSRLMKRGGVGYVQPGHDSFPPVDKLHELILACQALPCAAWLDGTTSGEQRMDELLALLVDKGAVVLNIVPDRNWDIADSDIRAVKVQKLYEVVELAREFELPLNVGTEMNSYGQKLIDEFDATLLQPVRQDFIDGAYFVYGHTAMARLLDMGYQSEWAKQLLPERGKRNLFYTQVGKALPPGESGAAKATMISPEAKPSEVLRLLGVGT
ncbi:MAG: PHP domain-containing protein [Caldilineaceae bacterium]|jgi:hypothetical protein